MLDKISEGGFSKQNEKPRVISATSMELKPITQNLRNSNEYAEDDGVDPTGDDSLYQQKLANT